MVTGNRMGRGRGRREGYKRGGMGATWGEVRRRKRGRRRGGEGRDVAGEGEVGSGVGEGI